MVEAAIGAGEDPLRLSSSRAPAELIDLLPGLVLAGPRRAAEESMPRLLGRMASHIVPLRPGRT